MRKILQIFSVLCLLFIASAFQAKADTWEYEMNSLDNRWLGLKNNTPSSMSLNNQNKNASIDVVEWQVEFDATNTGIVATTSIKHGFKYAVQIGSTNAQRIFKTLTLSTKTFAGKKITNLTVFYAASASAGQIKLDWTNGSFSSANEEIVVTGNSGVEATTCKLDCVGDELTIVLSNNSSTSTGCLFGGMIVEYEDVVTPPAEPVDPHLSIANVKNDEIDLVEGQAFVPEFTPAGLTITAENEDDSVAKFEDGKIIAVAPGSTIFTFTSEATNGYTAGETYLMVNVTEYVAPAEQTVTFDFTTSEGVESISFEQGFVTKPASGSTKITAPFSKDDVTISLTKGTADPAIYPGNLRVYRTGGTVTISAPNGYSLSEIAYTYSIGTLELTEGQFGTFANKTWTADEKEVAQEVVFSVTVNVQITKIDVTIKKLPEVATAIEVVYNGEDANGEDDHYTIKKESVFNVNVVNGEASRITYKMTDEKLENGKYEVVEEGEVEDNVLVLDMVGKWRIEFAAFDADGNVIAEKTIYVIVKEDDSHITSDLYTLDFEQFHYGMDYDPEEGMQSGTSSFTGKNTNGLDFFIPAGQNRVYLHQEGDAQHLVMHPGSRFTVNIDNYGRKIEKIVIAGENLENLIVKGGEENLTHDLNETLTVTPQNSILRGVEISHETAASAQLQQKGVKRAATAADAVRIKNVAIHTGVETGVEFIDSENVEAVYYDLQGNRVDAANLGKGIYICRQGAKVSKVMVR